MVAAHLALVGDAGEPAGAGQHREQRQFRQRHRRRAVVDQHDVVGRERELVAAARRGAVDHADGREAGVLARILDAVARLVGELAEIDLVGVGRARQHADVGAGAEHPRLARAQQDDLHLRMLEAQPLDGVGELDVDAEVVGIELELVALEQRALLVDVHEQASRRRRRPRASSGGSATDRSGNRSGSCRWPACALRQPWRFLDRPSTADIGMFPTAVAYSDRARDDPAFGAAASRLRGDRAAAGWRSRRSRAASPRAPRGAARAAHPAASRPRPGSSIPAAPSRSAAGCRIGRSRPARSGSARGYRPSASVMSQLRKSGSSQGPDQSRNASSTSACKRASFARNGPVSNAILRTRDLGDAHVLGEEVRRHQHEPAHAMILHAAGIDRGDRRAVAVTDAGGRAGSRWRRARAAARRAPRRA